MNEEVAQITPVAVQSTFMADLEESAFRRLRRVVTEEGGVHDEEVIPTASLQRDLGFDSLDVVELVMALEDEFGIDLPDLRSRIRSLPDVTVADMAGFVADALADPVLIQQMCDEVTRGYMPELLETPYRIDNKTILLRYFLQSRIFQDFVGRDKETEFAVLRKFFQQFGGQRVRNVFGVPVREGGKEKMYILFYLDHACGVISLVRSAGEFETDAFSDVAFSQISLRSSTSDQWAWSLNLGHRIVYIAVPEQFSSLVLARLREMKSYLTAPMGSAPKRRFLRKRHIDMEATAAQGGTANILPKCYLTAVSRTPYNILGPSNLRVFLQTVPSENSLVQRVIEPILRGQMFEIKRSINHGTDDTSQERGADVIATRTILGDSYIIGCVVKRGSLRKRGSDISIKLADVRDQVRLALTCTVNLEGETRRPDAVYVVVSGEVPEDLKVDLYSLARDPQQRVFVWDRSTLIDLYLQSNVDIAEQTQLYDLLANAV